MANKKQDWSSRDTQPDIEYELRRQLKEKFGWPHDAIDSFFEFLSQGGAVPVGGFSSASVLMDISKAFAATRKVYPLPEWRG